MQSAACKVRHAKCGMQSAAKKVRRKKRVALIGLGENDGRLFV
jgi:hypothetical protein